MSYVLFVMIHFSSLGNPSNAATSFQFEFKDKAQCENTILNIKKRFVGDHWTKFKGFCQEVRK